MDQRQQLLQVLTPKQQKFCHLYLSNSSAAKSYAEAYNITNEEVARKSGWRLLRANPKVGAFLRYEQAALATRYALPKARLIEMHYKVVELYNELLDLLKIKNKSKDDKDRVKEIQSSISTADYRLALAEIGKLQGEYVNKSETTTTTKTIRIVSVEPENNLLGEATDVEFSEVKQLAEPTPSDIIIITAAEQLPSSSDENTDEQ